MFYIEVFNYIYYMMPGSKGLSPHELAHKWVKDLTLYSIHFMIKALWMVIPLFWDILQVWTFLL